MVGFIDDLAGSIYDFFKLIFKCIFYVFVGMLIIGVPLYLITFVFRMFH